MILTLVQWKGGVGKSTLSVHLAAHLGAVLVDLEPWGGATVWWAGRRAADLWQHAGPAPVLKALASGAVPRPRKGGAGRPLLVPSHEGLLALTDGSSPTTAAWAWSADGRPTLLVPTPAGPRPLAQALREALPHWANEWGRDVVVDTPAGFGPLADGATAAADVVVCPVTLDQWAVPALRRFMSAYRSRVRAGLIVPNRVRPRRADNDWAELLTDHSIIEAPFELGPPVAESEVLHTAPRPLGQRTRRSLAHDAALHDIAAVAERAKGMVS
ncbi:MAG: chromosome partitioning protein [Acidimicrobiaceae bacterium]|jgi:cellulose biosynthesis protein BcsQ|nr:chromosome partitioning protein [Acidimicrobiaceae bacterium]